jgi:hypothetical protein
MKGMLSLIPSESLNFPDSFRATITSKSAKQKSSLPPPNLFPQTVPVELPSVPLASQKEKTSLPPPTPVPQIVPVETPRALTESQKEKTAPPPPKPLPQVVPVEPHRIPVVPRAKVRFSKQSAEGLDDFGTGRRDPLPNAIGGHGQKKFTPSAVAKSEESAAIGASPTWPSEGSLVVERPSSRRERHMVTRRRNKVFRFVLCEVGAISILLPLIMLGLSGRFTDRTLIVLIRILMVGAMVAVLIFPMIFFRRWENSRARQR